MISPEEIKSQALKWWQPFLQSYINNESFFPRQIGRIGKVQPTHVTNRFEVLRNEIDALYEQSKNKTGTGYLVKTEDKNFRRTGAHELPDSIVFETADDFLDFIGKKKEWRLFQQNYESLIKSLPLLKEWIVNNVLWLTMPDTNWADIIKVCHYFIATPRPNLYLRQLPIEIHTKFIEENSALLQSLLDFLIPDHIKNSEQRKFAERYFLKHDEPFVRIKILDVKLAFYNGLTEISIQISDFEKNNWLCNNVLITENKMNFLALPSMPSTIAVWSGGGFKVSYLKNASWLKEKRLYYWGDIDEHGFQILHQIRSYYQHTQSIMMDIPTFNSFQEFAVAGERNKSERLALLNSDEAELYAVLKKREDKNRLEQEKIPQVYADAILKSLFIKSYT